MNDDLDALILLTTQLLHRLGQKSEVKAGHRAATMLQVNSLIYLKNNPGVTMSDFSANLSLSPSSAAQLAERLNLIGYIKRSEDTKDRRTVRLAMTKKGTDYIEKIHRRMHKKFKRVFSKVPQKDIKELIRIQKELLNS